MLVLVAGAHGKIGRRLIARMQDGPHRSRAMIRDPAQADELRACGADEVVVADLEKDCRHATQGCDAVIFSAGSGGHTGPEKTVDVDRNGAIALIDTARETGVSRFVMVSSMRADDPDSGPENMRHYFRAKHDADQHLRDSGLDYTIVRPGRLTDDDGTGCVDVAPHLERHGEVPRDDVAAVLLAALDSPATVGRAFEVLSGDTPIRQAVAAP